MVEFVKDETLVAEVTNVVVVGQKAVDRLASVGFHIMRPSLYRTFSYFFSKKVTFTSILNVIIKNSLKMARCFSGTDISST